MELESLQVLEERIAELTEKYLFLKKGHDEVLSALADKDRKIEELNEKLNQFQQTKEQVNSRIENILKKLEFLKANADQ